MGPGRRNIDQGLAPGRSAGRGGSGRWVGGACVAVAVLLAWGLGTGDDRAARTLWRPRTGWGPRNVWAEPAAGGGASRAAPPSDWLRKARFLGAQSCQGCHAAYYASYVHTSHAQTSRWPSEESLLGDFTGPGQRMNTRRPDVWFEMTRRDDGWYQTAVEGQPPRRRSERIDIVTGSGKLGQSYLYWRENQLFQMPVTYLSSLDAWVNSPNYVDGQVWFDRPIIPRCLDCHATWLEYEPGTTNTYTRSQALLGVSCERCHGPGSEHAAWHQGNPQDKTGRAIVNPVRLPRMRQLEICGQCHSAVGRLLRPAFDFRPGDVLAEYVDLGSEIEQARLDLHSNNQLPRLCRSRCFQASEELTCTSCHDPHARQRGDLAAYSSRCVRCHQVESCGLLPRAGARGRANCIDCHLSKVESISDITFNTPDQNNLAPLRMRDHQIRIDRELAERVLRLWESEAQTVPGETDSAAEERRSSGEPAASPSPGDAGF